MTTSIPEVEQDLGKVQFQEELNRWFESRGIIADLRSHLRHLMITALQNTQVGVKPIDRTSPKAQALNLIVAEYLLRRECHYTLSVLTSEVPTLTNFTYVNPKIIKKLGPADSKKRMWEYCFQEREIEEIFNAMGLPCSVDDLDRAKVNYLNKSNENSLLELLIQTVGGMATKLQIRENVESYQVDDGKRLLSKKWSLRLVDILLSEKIKSPQIASLEEAIFRITENEMKRIIGEEHKSQIRILAERERRIQEYLKRHENEIIQRLIEAEKDLEMRTDLIEEEFSERQRHLSKMAMEWSEKHDKIVKLSKNFYDIECENKRLQKTIEELEKENQDLKKQEQKQKEAMEELKNEISSLMIRVKEVTESNAILSERIEVLIRRENKEVSVNHDQAVQGNLVEQPEIPLLWSGTQAPDDDTKSTGNRPQAENESSKPQKLAFKVNYYDTPSLTDRPKNPKKSLKAEKQVPCLNLSEDEYDASILRSSSSEEVLLDFRKKLKNLEEESDRINKNYLEYKSKNISVESDSEISKSISVKSEEIKKSSPLFPVFRETRSSQTERQKRFEFRRNLEKRFSTELYLPVISKAHSEERLSTVSIREPTKRQLQNREYFLKSRQLLKEFEKRNVDEQTTPTSIQISSSSSSERNPSKLSKKKITAREDLVVLTPLRTASFYCNDLPLHPQEDSNPQEESKVVGNSNPIGKIGFDCLALLEETRIKSPQEEIKKKSLRQQVLSSESEEIEEKIESGKSKKSSKLGTITPSSTESKVSARRNSFGNGFW